MKLWSSVAGVAIAATLGLSVLAPASESQTSTGGEPTAASSYGTIVDANGAISFPADYKSWRHMGSWAVVNENGEGNGIHNVFTTPDVIEAFKETGEFPDGSVLVKEVLASEGAALTTGSANWATAPQVWFVMIKDSEGRFPGNDLWGNGWGWALFQADDPTKQVATNFEADCLGCHVPAENTDWVYTYAYPELGVAKQTKFETPAQDEAPAGMGAGATAPTGDAEAGKAAFAVCRTCHSLDEGRNGLGPSLAGLAGSKAGSASEGFGYSDALKGADVVWNAATLDKWLTDTGAFIPGNRMAQLFPANVKDDTTRENIVAYLIEETSN